MIHGRLTCEGLVDIALEGVRLAHVPQSRDVLRCVGDDDCLEVIFLHKCCYHFFETFLITRKSLTFEMIEK